MDAPRVVQLSSAPEPNPVERFFRKLRRAVEGRVYLDLQAKQVALEPILKAGWPTRHGRGNCATGAGSTRPCRPCPPILK